MCIYSLKSRLQSAQKPASSVSVVTGLRVRRTRNRGLIPGRDKGLCNYTRTSKPALGPTHSRIEWGMESVYAGRKRPGLEVASHVRLLLRLRMMGSYLYSAIGLIGVHRGQLYYYELISRFCRFPFNVFSVRFSVIADIRHSSSSNMS